MSGPARNRQGAVTCEQRPVQGEEVDSFVALQRVCPPFERMQLYPTAVGVWALLCRQSCVLSVPLDSRSQAVQLLLSAGIAKSSAYRYAALFQDAGLLPGEMRYARR